jgi:hypothetical protein
MPYVFAVYDWKMNRAEVLDNLAREIDSFLGKRSSGVVTVRLNDPARVVKPFPEPCPPAK